MKITIRKALCAGAVAVVGVSVASIIGLAQQPAPGLQPIAAFAGITDPVGRSVAFFKEAGKVIQHPRCLNCHPAGDRPSQKDIMGPHEPPAFRGGDGLGAVGMRCATCHQAENDLASGVPGHANWHLAPASMAWQGKTLRQICEQVQDPNRNGGMDTAKLIPHMGEDTLVGWAWRPGADRTPAPGTQAEFGALVKAWLESGAHCPQQ
jgi:hypothetical protein